jgi:hypothetical protein
MQPNSAGDEHDRDRDGAEGRLVEADWFKGEWSTLRLYALLDREWRAGTLSGP